jgi:hypothetical protein
LVEVRVGMLASRSDIDALKEAVIEALQSQYHAVVCVDLRGGRLLPEDLAEALLGVMRADNPLFHRCASLVASATLGLQMVRLTREAANPHRRIFDTPGELALWLRPDLTGIELERLQAFLNERPSLSGELRGVPPATPS